jgi:hypothetical protein
MAPQFRPPYEVGTLSAADAGHQQGHTARQPGGPAHARRRSVRDGDLLEAVRPPRPAADLDH